jgi:hypothetical protein
MSEEEWDKVRVNHPFLLMSVLRITDNDSAGLPTSKCQKPFYLKRELHSRVIPMVDI